MNNGEFIEYLALHDPAIRNAFDMKRTEDKTYEDMLEILVLFFKEDRDSLRSELLKIKMNLSPTS